MGLRLRSLFEIPAGWEPVAMLAIGYLGDPKILSAPLQEKELTPRNRKPLTDFIFSGKWH